MRYPYVVYFTLIIGILLLVIPEETQENILKIDIRPNIRQMIACILLLTSYYFYNNEKLF
jgi:hypothetical protein